MTKIDIKNDMQLGTVQETLLLPLLARAEESTWKDPILRDNKALELVERLHFDKHIAKKHITDIGILGLAVRAYKMDVIIKKFMLSHPNGKILNIGAGLDTAFYRCDDGKVRWYDLDLPDAMALRKKLLPIDNARVTEIAKSMFDYTWIDDIGDISGGLLIFIPGVLPYFKEADIRPLFRTIAKCLLGAEVLFDSTNDIARYFIGRKIKKAGMPDTNLGWGLWHHLQLYNMSPSIQVLKFEPFFKGISRKRSFGILLNGFMNANDLFSTTNLVHIKFKS